jgi:hypothetical protein
MDIRAYSQKAWDSEVDSGNPWTIPDSHEMIEIARRVTFFGLPLELELHLLG